MPTSAWSAPVPNLNVGSISPGIAASLTDISPAEVVMLAGILNVGTRIRLYAVGEYTATSSTPTVVLGFYASVVGTAIAASSSGNVIAASAANTAGAAATAWPWKCEWQGRITALSGPADAATSATLYGQGQCYWATSLTAWVNSPMPVTAALRTVTQASVTAFNTNANIKLMIGSTWSTTTGVTSMTCDELTCELVG